MGVAGWPRAKHGQIGEPEISGNTSDWCKDMSRWAFSLAQEMDAR